MLKLNTDMIEPFVGAEDYKRAMDEAFHAFDTLVSGKGVGGKMTGWLDLPVNISEKTLADCRLVASRWLGTLDVVVVIGIGGSFLGAKCALEAFSHSFASAGERNSPHIVFAGYSLSEDYMSDLLGYLKKKSYGLIVISKSGTTIEPGLAFRILNTSIIRTYTLRQISDDFLRLIQLPLAPNSYV